MSEGSENLQNAPAQNTKSAALSCHPPPPQVSDSRYVAGPFRSHESDLTLKSRKVLARLDGITTALVRPIVQCCTKHWTLAMLLWACTFTLAFPVAIVWLALFLIAAILDALQTDWDYKARLLTITGQIRGWEAWRQRSSPRTAGAPNKAPWWRTPPPPHPSQAVFASFVYVIGPARGTGPWKIGKANRPELRLKQLQTGHPEELRIFAQIPHRTPGDALGAEREAHRALARYRSHGEWFVCDLPSIMRRIN